MLSCSILSCAHSELAQLTLESAKEESNKFSDLQKAQKQYFFILENLERLPDDTGLIRMKKDQLKVMDSLNTQFLVASTQKREAIKRWELEGIQNKNELSDIRLIEKETQERLKSQQEKIQKSLQGLGQ